MADKEDDTKRDYEVGYGKPPKHSRFVPGQSGFKGRRRKKSDDVKSLVARIRDEDVTVGGQTMTRLEVTTRQVFNATLKSGKPRDLKLLFDLLEKYGAISAVDQRAEAEAGAEEAMRKIFSAFHRTFDIDPNDSEAHDRDNDAETKLVMDCPSCGPQLSTRWKVPDYVARSERYARSTIHSALLASRERLAKKRR